VDYLAWDFGDSEGRGTLKIGDNADGFSVVAFLHHN
jgi:hypothetical protein